MYAWCMCVCMCLCVGVQYWNNIYLYFILYIILKIFKKRYVREYSQQWHLARYILLPEISYRTKTNINPAPQQAGYDVMILGTAKHWHIYLMLHILNLFLKAWNTEEAIILPHNENKMQSKKKIQPKKKNE